jgi:predicted RNA-binding protein
MPGAIITGEISQSEGDWVFEDFRICVTKEDGVVQTSIEYPKPA